MSKTKQGIAVRNVTRRLLGKRVIPTHVVFEQWETATFRRDVVTGHRVKRVAVVGVWIDLEKLSQLAERAVDNKTRKAKDGALNVEFHFVKEATHV